MQLYCLIIQRYTTRKDNSPLINALEEWRASTLQHRERNDSTPSAASIGTNTLRPEEPRLVHARSKSEPPEEMRIDAVALAAESRRDRVPMKPSKAPWSWWSRSRKNSSNLESGMERPPLKGSVSAPPAVRTKSSFMDGSLDNH